MKIPLKSRLLELYIFKAIVPYFVLSFLLLTAVLLSQQAGKFTEILGTARAPLSLIFEVALGIIPNVMIFTVPMSMLIGTATGFARMGSDSELVAMRAAGVGTLRQLAPVLVCGLVLTSFTIWNGFEVAPAAARLMRQSLLRATLYRLETPVQPRSFNTQMPGKVIYVRDGDEVRGEWGRVFIHWLDAGGDIRLVTARSGRIDLTGEQTELVLVDAVVMTLPSSSARERGGSGAEFITERSAQLRIRLTTGKNAIIRQLEERPEDPEESDWRALLLRSRSNSEPERLEALAVFHKKLALCFTPLTFAILGVGLGARSRRGGRSLGVFLSLLSMLLFYLLLLGGDFFTRTGMAPAFAGEWMATVLSLLIGLGLVIKGEASSSPLTLRMSLRGDFTQRLAGGKRVGSGRRIAFLGFLDRGIIGALLLNFSTALFVLVSIFLIFTLFDLLRFLTTSSTSFRPIIFYLLYLTPFAVIGVVPIATLISILVTYALMAKRNEAVAWWSSGQSLYRLAAPSLFFSLAVAGCYAFVQESVLPSSNAKQDALRAQIRGGAIRASTSAGFQWVATSDRRIYSYKVGEGSDHLSTPVLYEFDHQGVHLVRVIGAENGEVSRDGNGLLFKDAEIFEKPSPEEKLSHFKVQTLTVPESASAEAFTLRLKRPAELNFEQLSSYIKRLRSAAPNSNELPLLAIAKWRKGVDPLSPVIMWLNGVPLAIAFGRRSTVAALGVAVLLGLTFWVGESAFQQLGVYRLIPAAAAALSLPVLFTFTGFFIFSKVKT